MSEKRHKKIEGALVDLPTPQVFSKDETLDVGVISWGSTFGAALEAVLEAQKRGHKVGGLKMTSLYPYHSDAIRAFMKRCQEVLIPELNYEGQLANLIGHLYERDIVRLNRATGVPLAGSAILERIEALMG
jgi:2-oxoglutarate ferredoxin oxidoreductase subunit alpha